MGNRNRKKHNKYNKNKDHKVEHKDHKVEHKGPKINEIKTSEEVPKINEMDTFEKVTASDVTPTVTEDTPTVTEDTPTVTEDTPTVTEDTAEDDGAPVEEPTIEDKVNARQEDIIDNYVGPIGDVGVQNVESIVPEKYSLSHSTLATAIVDTVREFKRVTDIRPYVGVNDKVVIKYQLSVLVDDLFKDPIAAKIAIINLVNDQELPKYIVALSQLTNQIHWKYNNDLLITADIFLNVVTIYDYKVNNVNVDDTRPKIELFKTYLFKSGASKAVASTIAELVY